MKKTLVLKKLGGVCAVAAALDIAPASVSGWGDEIPPLRAYQLREKFPQLFGTRQAAGRTRERAVAGSAP